MHVASSVRVHGLWKRFGATEILKLHVGHADKATMEQNFDNLTDDELFALARKANQAVFARAIPLVERFAKKHCKQYYWIDPSDLAQEMLKEIPRIAYNYREDDASGNTWSKYLYHRLYFVAKDCLRREDPLGIGWPQKKAYPQWHRLGDESLTGFVVPDESSDADVTVDDSSTLDEFQRDIESLKQYFMDAGLPRKLTPHHWDKTKYRVRFRICKASRMATWVKHYWERRGNPLQLQLELD